MIESEARADSLQQENSSLGRRITLLQKELNEAKEKPTDTESSIMEEKINFEQQISDVTAKVC